MHQKWAKKIKRKCFEDWAKHQKQLQYFRVIKLWKILFRISKNQKKNSTVGRQPGSDSRRRRLCPPVSDSNSNYFLRLQLNLPESSFKSNTRLGTVDSRINGTNSRWGKNSICPTNPESLQRVSVPQPKNDCNQSLSMIHWAWVSRLTIYQQASMIWG